jgi:hypothetical protein
LTLGIIATVLARLEARTTGRLGRLVTTLLGTALIVLNALNSGTPLNGSLGRLVGRLGDILSESKLVLGTIVAIASLQKTADTELLAVPTGNITKAKPVKQVKVHGHLVLVQTTYTSVKLVKFLYKWRSFIYLAANSHTRRDGSSRSKTTSC